MTIGSCDYRQLLLLLLAVLGIEASINGRKGGDEGGQHAQTKLSVTSMKNALRK